MTQTATKYGNVYSIRNKNATFNEVFDYIYHESLALYNKQSKYTFIECCNKILKENEIIDELYYPILDLIIDMGNGGNEGDDAA